MVKLQKKSKKARDFVYCEVSRWRTCFQTEATLGLYRRHLAVGADIIIILQKEKRIKRRKPTHIRHHRKQPIKLGKGSFKFTAGSAEISHPQKVLQIEWSKIICTEKVDYFRQISFDVLDKLQRYVYLIRTPNSLLEILAILREHN